MVLKNGSRFFIEVKNCNHKNSEKALSLKKSYISALKKYAQINNGRLKFAIYFSSFNQWVLLPIEHFDKQQNSYCINLTKALIKNEMGTVLGDTLVGTTPPLKIEFITNPIEKKSTNGRRQLFFTIDEIKLYCADVEIIDELEKEIAFYLIRYGDWLESDSYTVDKNNNLLSVVFEYSPVDPNYEQGFDIIGSLSSMISSAYSELTVHNQKVSALDVELNPSALLVEIPEDYKGRYMPLWRILPKANPYF